MGPIVLALLTALLTIVSFPPFEAGSFAFVALAPLLLATGTRSRRDFFLGWLAGWTASLGLVWWVINTIVHYGGIGWTVAVPILLLMTGVMGFFWALFTWARGVLHRRYPLLTDILLAPVLWVSLEYIQSRLPDIAFPWTLLGYSQFLRLPLIQVADLFGVWAVSFLLVMVNGAVAAIVRPVFTPPVKTSPAGRLLPAAAAAAMVSAALIYGFIRMNDDDGGKGSASVAVVQGNVEQDVKWDPDYREETFRIYTDLTVEAAEGGADLVVWPETATPFFYQSQAMYRERLRELVKESGVPLLFGSPAFEERAGETVSLRNRAYLMDGEGVLRGWYDKMHLVPFGEYVPWERLLFFVDKLVAMSGEFIPGEELKILSSPAGSFGTLICYEIIFPDQVRRFTLGGADFLVNITNDAWFGRTAASRQHFSTLVFRAVENRRPLARAANTGISGFVDDRGKILKASDIFVRGTWKTRLHFSKELTWYVRHGDFFPLTCLFAGLLSVVGVLFFRRRSTE